MGIIHFPNDRSDDINQVRNIRSSVDVVGCRFNLYPMKCE
jgi:hypothetical protein